MKPTIFIVSEGLVAPPRVGFQVHLLSLACALAQFVNVRALAWLPDRDRADWERWVRSLPPGTDPDRFLRPISEGPRRGSVVGRKLRCWRKAQDLIAQEGRAGDVIWVRELPTALFALPQISRLLPGRRHMTHLYDVASIVELEMIHSDGVRLARLKPIVERWLRCRFDLVRTLGHGMKNFLVDSGVQPNRVIVAPVGADRPIALHEPGSALHRLLYIGSAEQWQGLRILLDAMASLEQRNVPVRLTVAGIDAAAVGVPSIPGNVDLVGWADRERITELYRSHDLFLIPRPRTPLTDTVIPMKAVEAQAHGIPILASRLGAIEEVTGGQSAVLVEPGSATAIASAIEDLRLRPERLSELAAAARRRADRFAWETVAADLVAQLFGPGRLPGS